MTNHKDLVKKIYSPLYKFLEDSLSDFKACYNSNDQIIGHEGELFTISIDQYKRILADLMEACSKELIDQINKDKWFNKPIFLTQLESNFPELTDFIKNKDFIKEIEYDPELNKKYNLDFKQYQWALDDIKDKFQNSFIAVFDKVKTIVNTKVPIFSFELCDDYSFSESKHSGAFEDLHDRLESKDYISKVSFNQFEHIFKKTLISKPLFWRKSLAELEYFITQLINQSIIKNPLYNPNKKTSKHEIICVFFRELDEENNPKEINIKKLKGLNAKKKKGPIDKIINDLKLQLS